MNRLKTSLCTAVGLVLLAGIVSLAYQKGVDAQVGSTPVRVVNTATAPALMREVDRRVPYQAFLTSDPLTGDPNLAAPNSFTALMTFPNVPAGKRLVIEEVTVRASVPLGQQAEAEILLVLNTIGSHGLDMTFKARGTRFDRDTYKASQKVLAFEGEFQTPQILIRRSGTGTWEVEGGISGYLVDL